MCNADQPLSSKGLKIFSTKGKCDLIKIVQFNFHPTVRPNRHTVEQVSGNPGSRLSSAEWFLYFSKRMLWSAVRSLVCRFTNILCPVYFSAVLRERLFVCHKPSVRSYPLQNPHRVFASDREAALGRYECPEVFLKSSEGTHLLFFLLLHDTLHVHGVVCLGTDGPYDHITDFFLINFTLAALHTGYGSRRLAAIIAILCPTPHDGILLYSRSQNISAF